MTIQQILSSVQTAQRTHATAERAVGVAGVVALGGLSVLAYSVGVTWKLLAISWVAFAAMAIGAPLGARTAQTAQPVETVWGYGLASGAMVTSAALFLIPQALGQHGRFGSLGIAAGFLAGYVGHAVGHRLTHLNVPIEQTAAELTVHALAAGAIIGAIYTAMPSLTSILGVALVSHKAPAGYAAARRLADRDRSVVTLLLPAAAVGLIALPVGMTGLSPSPMLRGLLFGFGAGVFLHVAVDLLPECTAGSDTCPVDAAGDSDAHRFQDRLRTHAAVSSLVGAAVVVAAWLVVV